MGEPVEQPPTKASAGRKSVVCLMRCMDVHEVDSLFVTFFFLEKKDILAFVRKKNVRTFRLHYIYAWL